jgi:predicted nuclease of restriction endonuclease-like (RecB) superfamily
MHDKGRQISTQFYERLALSKRKAPMLEKGHVPRPEDAVSADEVIRDSRHPSSGVVCSLRF